MAEHIEYMEYSDDRACLERVHAHTLDTLQKQSTPVLPDSRTLVDARVTLPLKLPDQGLGMEKTTNHLLQDIAPALNGSRYAFSELFLPIEFHKRSHYTCCGSKEGLLPLVCS